MNLFFLDIFSMLEVLEVSTLPPEKFGAFGSVWCKNGPSKHVTSMMMPSPRPSGFRLLKTFFKSHNFFIMEK